MKYSYNKLSEKYLLCKNNIEKIYKNNSSKNVF